MILMSSQKVKQNKQNIIDIGLLRSNAIASNHVYYMCTPHLKSMILSGVLYSTICVCHLFTQPFHLLCDNSFQTITELFSKTQEVEDDTDTLTNYSMLMELGIDLTSVNNDMESLSTNTLCARNARVHLQTNSISLKMLLKENQSRCVVSDTVMVYIDPAPVVGDKSFNALCFTTRIATISETNTHKYVIIAVENFRSDQLKTHNYELATARMLIKDITDICTVYGGHFKKFLVAPEANSISMVEFLAECRRQIRGNKILSARNGPKIYFTTIKTTVSKRKKTSAIVSEEHQQKLSLLQFEEDHLQSGYLVQNRLIFPDIPRKTPRKRKILNVGGGADDDDDENDDVRYRLGYFLGKNKTQIYLDFIFREYNGLNVFCASEIFGHSLCSKNVSIPTMIADYLDHLTVKHNQTHINKHNWEILGKCTKKGEFIKDDVTDAVVMSIMLFPFAVGEQIHSNPLFELTLHQENDSDYLDF